MKLFESRIGPSVFKSYYNHAEMVFETVENMNKCVKAACEGSDISDLIKATSESELKADKVKSEIKSANEKENLFTNEEKELLSNFINKVREELSINGSQ